MLIRRHSGTINTNTIIYAAPSRVVPSVTTGFGATYNDSKSTWDSTTGIGRIVFDGEVTTIPNGAFKQNSKITGILEFPATLHTIDNYAFRFDEANTNLRSQIKSIKFNEGLLYINNRSFLSNRNLTEIKLPNSIYKIADYAFNGCINTEKITIGEGFRMFTKSGNNEYNDGAGVIWGAKLDTVVWNSINCYDFIMSEYSPFTTTSIVGSTEHAKNPIKNVYFGDKVKNIPGAIFWKCPNISNEIVIPASCERIGDRAFQACSSIKTVFCYATTPPKIEPNTTSGTAFQNEDGKNAVFREYVNSAWRVLPNLTIYVPSESLEAYINDKNWGVYANIIKAFRPEYKSIDLGLRTSDGKKILFCDKNIFAPDEYHPGGYTSQGDVNNHYIPYNGETTQTFIDNHIFNASTYKYSDDTYSTISKYNSSDKLTTLNYWDDPACVHLGGTWRTPTKDEISLLLDENNFKREIIDIDGNIYNKEENKPISGIRFVSKISGFAGKSIFFGAFGAGNNENCNHVNFTMSIWTATLAENEKECYFLYLYKNASNDYVLELAKNYRYYGRQTRAVRIE